MSAPLWTSEAIAAATGGRSHGGRFDASGVAIDSRTLAAGDLFVALAGERDGHDFLARAFAAGAAGALTNRPTGGPCVVATDTLAALRRLGEAARERALGARRAAVTGSVGKTSITQAVLAGLSRAGAAHGSVQSFNNHIGVPLTLARMPPDTARAVFEIGMNHAGEIEPLSLLVRPHVAAITTIGAVHVENFPDGEAGVARAKSEIFAGLEAGGVAILDADSRWFAMLSAAAVRAGAKVRSFGVAAASDARLESFTRIEQGARVRAAIDGEVIEFPIPAAARHWGKMSLCALEILRALAVKPGDALAALASLGALEGRGAERPLVVGGAAVTLIDESYNANPISTAAALRTLGEHACAGRRIAVLTDMLELGAMATAAHAALADDIAAARVDLVFCAGPLMRALWSALPPAARGAHAACAGGLTGVLIEALRSGDVVMVKGSKGSKAWAIAEALDAASRGAA